MLPGITFFDDLGIPQEIVVLVLGIDFGSTKGAFHLGLIGEPTVRVHLDKAGFVDVVTAVKLGGIHVLETDGTRRDKQREMTRYPILMHNAHGVALIAERRRRCYRYNIKTLGAQRRGPQQRVECLQHLRDRRKREGKVVRQRRIGVAMNDDVLDGRLVRILFEFHGQRLDTKIIEVVVARKSVNLLFFGQGKLRHQAFKKRGPFVVSRVTGRRSRSQ